MRTLINARPPIRESQMRTWSNLDSSECTTPGFLRQDGSFQQELAGKKAKRLTHGEWKHFNTRIFFCRFAPKHSFCGKTNKFIHPLGVKKASLFCWSGVPLPKLSSFHLLCRSRGQTSIFHFQLRQNLFFGGLY